MGNANPILYQIGTAQVSGAAGIFHDILSGSNSVPGVTGFNAGIGYDAVTGLGSVDAFALVNTWTASVSAPVSSVGLLTGKPAILKASVTGAISPDLTWTCSAGGTITAGSPSSSATFTASKAGSYTVTAAVAALPTRTTTITVQVHDPHLMGTGTTVTGLDILDVLGHYGTTGTAADVNGDGLVNQADLDAMKLLLGWN